MPTGREHHLGKLEHAVPLTDGREPKSRLVRTKPPIIGVAPVYGSEGAATSSTGVQRSAAPEGDALLRKCQPPRPPPDVCCSRIVLAAESAFAMCP